MGNGILTHEVADSIKEIDELNPADEDCRQTVGVLGRATKLGLRLGEGACAVSKQNRIMLGILLIFTIKAEVLPLILKIASFLK